MQNMKNRPLLALYLTSGCHLCHAAEQVLREVLTPAAFESVEIAENSALLEQYGIRIPVLRRLDTGQELDWPFNAAMVRRLTCPSSADSQPPPPPLIP